MFRSANIFVYAIFAFNIYGGLSEMTESPEIANLENLLEDGIRKCGESCYSTLKPLADHITTSEQRWSSCISRNVNDAHNKIKSQLAALQEKLAINSILSSSVEFQQIGGRYFYIAENETVDKLNLILAEQNQVETQLTAIHNKLESKMPANFEKIGTRFFYIEQTEQKNWFGASDACRQMGGQLATIRTRTEQAAIERKLTPMQVYWVDVTDLAVEGEFVSMASGKPANYLNWGYGEPDNYHDFQHCIFLYNHYMYDSHCNTGCLFICEAIDEN
ncbi:hypothetical protein KR009_004921, partial [Drosophila setifemur]